MTETDLIIIGAGPGGYQTALKATKEGLKTILIEQAEVGGTCLNRGCIPTKCLCHAAEVKRLMEQGTLGVRAEKVEVSWQEIIARKDAVTLSLRQSVDALLQKAGVAVVKGAAKFSRNGDIIVGEEQYRAQNIIIATGSGPKFLDIQGAHLQGVLTSDELLRIGTLPRSMAIIGGGVIGMEFADVLLSFGVEVTVIEYCKEILPPFDRDIAKRLRLHLKQRGVSFRLGCQVTKIERLADEKDSISHCGARLSVSFLEKGTEQSVEAEQVLMAVGRQANTYGLNLDEAGVECGAKGILTDGNMLTSRPHVYAIGDVNGKCLLAHAAERQGEMALRHILGKPREGDTGVMPAAVFTSLEAAMAGLTEEEAKEQGVKYSVHKAMYQASGKALSMDKSKGIVKILADDHKRVIGAHILGASASDMIHEIALLMTLGGTLQDIRKTIHAHPTLSELVRDAAM